MSWFFGRKKELNSAVDLVNEFSPKFFMKKDDYDNVTLYLEFRSFLVKEQFIKGAERDRTKVCHTAWILMDELLEKIVEEANRQGGKVCLK